MKAIQKGFTLIELMITLVLLGIFAAIAVPSFNALIRGNQVQSKAEELVTFLQFARGQAALNRQPYEVQIKSNAPWEIRKSGSNEAVWLHAVLPRPGCRWALHTMRPALPTLAAACNPSARPAGGGGNVVYRRAPWPNRAPMCRSLG